MSCVPCTIGEPSPRSHVHVFADPTASRVTASSKQTVKSETLALIPTCTPCSKSILKTPRLQLLEPLTVLHAPGVVVYEPLHPAHTAWYTTPFLSKREVPPSTCSAPVPPKKVAYASDSASWLSTMR